MLRRFLRRNYNWLRFSLRWNHYLRVYGNFYVSDWEKICLNGFLSINRNVELRGEGGILFGNNVTLSSGVKLISLGLVQEDSQTSIDHNYGTIELGDNVWLGANVIVLSDITICSNVVVGAGSVVTSDILTKGVYGGIPARKIK